MLKLFLLCIGLAIAQLAGAAPPERLSIPALRNLLQMGFMFHDPSEATLGGHSPDGKVIRSIRNNTDDFVAKLRSIESTVRERAAAQSDPVLKSFSDRLVQTADALSSVDPRTARRARQYLESVQSSILALVGEAMKVVERFDQEKDSTAGELRESVAKLYLATNDTLRKTADALEPKQYWACR